MITPGRVPETHDESRYDASDRHEQEEQSRRPATRKKVRRWEIGVFIRKIVNGWLAYYKKFPPGSESEAPGPAGALAYRSGSGSAGGDDLETGGVSIQSGPGKGEGDGGPVGETRVETGVFLSSTTDTSGEPSDGS